MFARTTLLIVICRLNRHKRKLASADRREAESGQQARINPAHQRADKKQRGKRADAARADAQPGIKGGVTEQRLKKQRLQRDQRIEREAEQPEQTAAHGEVAVLENAQIHERILCGQFAHDKSDQG
jgi:hypothetical protein